MTDLNLIVVLPQLHLQQELKVAQEQTTSDQEAVHDQFEAIDELKMELEQRLKVLRTVEEERDTLMSELEELDRQNQEATQVRLITQDFHVHI